MDSEVSLREVTQPGKETEAQRGAPRPLGELAAEL